MAADDMDFEKKSGDDNEGELIWESKFKGRPVLSMRKHPHDKYPFSFGLGKARQIVENYEAIEEFVRKHDGEKE
jgi:hypothetical protein